jgi:trk system potassium uptake protein TrkA
MEGIVMYIVIAGIGLVGGELARRLVEHKHDVVVIDSDREACEKIYAELGVVAISGDVARVEVLEQAGIQKADVLVAATGKDADNLAAAILARSFGVAEVIVRMRNQAYENAYKLAGVTSILRVTNLMVNQMIMEIEKPQVRRIMTIGGGRAVIYSVSIPEGAKVAGMTVENLAKNSRFPPQCVVIAIYRSESAELLIPRGQQTILERDEVFLISPAQDITGVSELLTH